MPKKVIFEVDQKYFRPTELDILVGDSTKAEKILGWKAKTTLKELVNDMMQNDLKLANKEKIIKKIDEK
ncbi:GDP-mannose 4,6-dehydratase [Flavobacteriaceae bacterium]|nr:GDP-mannose 4,6-dehydratase [Flavobacteriaceae bacterium]